MTTAYTTLNDGLSVATGQNGLLPWSQGAGHVNPNQATNPGLVYDAGKADYVAYQCKVNRAVVSPVTDCVLYGTLDETYNLNLASITVANVVGNATVRRKVTNVGGASATHTASASVPGFSTLMTPASLALAAGASASFTLKLSATTAPASTWQFGSLSWTDGSHVVRSPVQARRGKAIVAPAELNSDKLAGSKLLPVMTGFNGRMTAYKGGVKDATLGAGVTLVAGKLSSAGLKAACVAGADTAAVKVYNVAVPAGTIVARFALRQRNTSGTFDDNDLGLLAPDGSWTYSGNDGSDESVQLASPAPGAYKVCVGAYDSNNPSMTRQLSSWLVTPADVGGKFVVALPSKSVAGNNTTVGMSWSGLDLDQRYVGGVQFLDLSGVVQAMTVLRVETGAAAIPAAQSERAMAKLRG